MNHIQQLYVHMGFHPAWKFGTVVELIVDRGWVVDVRDVSAEMQAIRSKMVEGPMQPGAGATEEEVRDWIESTFRLDYRL